LFLLLHCILNWVSIDICERYSTINTCRLEEKYPTARYMNTTYKYIIISM